MEPGAHSREQLAALLWGESADEDARTSLRQALVHIRRLLGDVLEANRATVRLAAPVICDAHQFITAMERREAETLHLRGGRFLEGLNASGAPAFEEWAEGLRHRLGLLQQEALRVACRDAVARTRWREAHQLAEEWLTHDPLSEEAASFAVEALHCLGHRSEALARYRRFREHHRQEMGVGPGERLQDLARRIERASASAAPDPEETEGPPRPAFEADLVGREPQWRTLTRLWNSLRRGGGRVVLVEGEAGSGKSRLVSEFARWAGTQGATVLRGEAHQSAVSTPFSAAAELLRSALGAPALAGTDPEWLAVAARLVPELRRRFPAIPAPPPAGRAEEPSVLLEGIVQLLLSLGTDEPAVITLDDLQWCDAESVACLQTLIRRLDRAPLLLILSVTVGDLGRGSAPFQLVQSARADARAATLALTPLSESDVWRLVRQLGNVRTPTGARHFARRLHSATDGNPFHIIETLKTMFSQGLLGVTPISREWVVPSSIGPEHFARIPLPRSVSQTIGDRMARLSEDLRELLASIAIAGGPVGVDVLSHVHGMSRMRIAALADTLIERHLVEEEDRAYRVAHPVTADVIRGELSVARQAEVHLALSLGLEAAAAGEMPAEMVGRIAWHARRGGDGARAVEYALRAMTLAESRSAWDEAFGWLCLAAEAGPARRQEFEGVAATLAMRAGWSTVPSLDRGPRRKTGTEPAVMDLRVQAAERPAD